MATTMSTRLREVEVQALDPARLEPLVGPERMATFEATAARVRELLDGRMVLNVNSTAAGGGVAEMLQTLLAYVRGAAIDARWAVIGGDPAFFAITKRIHNGLYGSAGDGGELGARERQAYERALRANADELLALVRPGDLVLLHDPQTAGLAHALHDVGALVVWRCHVGRDEPNVWTERAWAFLEPYLDEVDGYVFSRAAFAPRWADPARTFVIPPSIDPFSAKNEPMSAHNVRRALAYVGLLDGDGSPPVVPFTRRDGSPGRINRRVDVQQTGPAARPGAPLVLQASRWDAWKDMAGVMEGFADYVDPAHGAHLVLAGPAVTGVADDPEAAEVYDDCLARWRALPHAARSRVHLACVPMADPDEAAAIVNALQRHATVVAQKSLAEGFGLTVAEAMWKSRPVVGSAVGGIVDQVVDGEHGLLVDDPHDLPAFGEAVDGLLRDPGEAERLGRNARARAVAEFLGDRHLQQYARMFAALDGRGAGTEVGAGAAP
ncbi:MAG: glycosyltransferase [Thermoleophilia bacterium]|nr:glycosyltransferase [Thermoleophilia bacterium]